MTMLKLYHTPLSINSRRVWVTLLEKGLTFDLEAVNLSGDQFKPDFLSLNPFHHIPVLTDGERPIIESFAIMDYLEIKYPTPALMPKDAATLATVRMVQMVSVNELVPATLPMTMKALFGKDDPDAIAKAQKQVEVILQFFTDQLGSHLYFGGDQLTLADITAGTMAAWFPEMDISLAQFPTLSAWRERLMHRQSWQDSAVSPEALAAFKAKIAGSGAGR